MSVLTTYCVRFIQSCSSASTYSHAAPGWFFATVSHSNKSSGTQQPDGARSQQLPLLRLSRRSATLRNLVTGGYRRRDRGLLLVPRLTVLRTHATVTLDRPSGAIQMT